MKFSKPLFAICLLLFISCKNRQEVKNPAPTDSLQQAAKIFDTTRFEPNTIDTFRYTNLKYVDSATNLFYDAYIDTFSVDGCRFRFVNPVANKSQLDITIYLEKLINNNWVFNGYTGGTGNYGGGYSHLRDVNADGFVDITLNLRFVQAVYFFDPQNKNYMSINTIQYEEENINPDWELIDTARKIFCDFRELKEMCGDIHSKLYTYDGFVRHNLYDLELYNCTETNNDTHLITKLILSKCVKRKKNDPKFNSSEDSLVQLKSVTLKHPIDLDQYYDMGYFDYVKYWKELYKDLLGYR